MLFAGAQRLLVGSYAPALITARPEYPDTTPDDTPPAYER
jgi:hypothetical protein